MIRPTKTKSSNEYLGHTFILKLGKEANKCSIDQSGLLYRDFEHTISQTITNQSIGQLQSGMNPPLNGKVRRVRMFASFELRFFSFQVLKIRTGEGNDKYSY